MTLTDGRFESASNSCCEPARPLQRSLGPFGPEMRKKSRKCLPGPPAPEPRKVSKKSQEESEKTLSTLSGDSPETSQTVAETSRRLFGVPGPEAPGEIFETFSAFRAGRVRGTSVRGGLVRNVSCFVLAGLFLRQDHRLSHQDTHPFVANFCCVSFCIGGRRAGGSIQGGMKQMLVEVISETRTTEPGHSAQAESTQGVFP